MGYPGQGGLPDPKGTAWVECIHEDPSCFAGLLSKGVLVEVCRPCQVREFLERFLGIERSPGRLGDGAICLDGMAMDDLDRVMVVPGSEMAIRGEAVRPRAVRPERVARRPVRLPREGGQVVVRGNVAYLPYGPNSYGPDWPDWSGSDAQPFLVGVRFSGQASQDVCARVFGLGTVVRAEAFLDFLLLCDQTFWSGLKELRDGAQGKGGPRIPMHVWADGGNLIRLLVRSV